MPDRDDFLASALTHNAAGAILARILADVLVSHGLITEEELDNYREAAFFAAIGQLDSFGRGSDEEMEIQDAIDLGMKVKAEYDQNVAPGLEEISIANVEVSFRTR